MAYLLSALKAREKSSGSAAFLAIGLLAQAVGPSIKRHLPKISEAVRMSLPIKDAAAKLVWSFLGPFYGAIAVPSVTRCGCCRCGHRFYIAIRQVLLLSHAACAIAIAGFSSSW